MHKTGGDQVYRVSQNNTSCQEEILRCPYKIKKCPERVVSGYQCVLYYRNIRRTELEIGHYIDQLSATRKTKTFEIKLQIGKGI